MYTYICIIFIEFVNSIASVIYVLIFFFGHEACGVFAPPAGMEPVPLCTAAL